MLIGIDIYVVPEETKAAAQRRSAAAGPATGPAARQHRKQLQKTKPSGNDEAIRLHGAEDLALTHLPLTTLIFTKFWPECDQLVFVLEQVLVNVCAHVLGTRLLDWPPNPFLPCLLPIGALIGMYSLASVQLSRYTSVNEKQVTIMVGSVCGLLSFILVLLCPQWVINFRLLPACQGATTLMRLTADRLAGVLPIPEAILAPLRGGADPLVGGMLLALLGGLQGGLLFEAVVRTSRCYHAATHTPDWATDKGYIVHSWVWHGLVQCGMHLSLVLPAVPLVLWIHPLTEEFRWGKPDVIIYAQAASLLLSGCVQALLVRSYVQAYSHTALIAWHTIKHADEDRVTVAQRAASIRARVDTVNTFLCKVAAQALAPAATLIAAGALLLVYCLPDAPGSSPAWKALCFTTGSFLGWWGSLCWIIYSVIVLAMFRFGAISS